MQTIYKYSLKRTRSPKICEALANYEDIGLNTPAMVHEFLKPLKLNETEQEQFVCILMDIRNKPKGYHISSIGTIDQAAVYISQSFRFAVINMASNIIFAHTKDGAPPLTKPSCTIISF